MTLYIFFAQNLVVYTRVTTVNGLEQKTNNAHPCKTPAKLYIQSRVSTSARNAGDPWFESRSWYDQFLYVYINACIVQHFKSSKILNSDTVEHM